METWPTPKLIFPGWDSFKDQNRTLTAKRADPGTVRKGRITADFSHLSEDQRLSVSKINFGINTVCNRVYGEWLIVCEGSKTSAS